jgi:hypothetical protein
LIVANWRSSRSTARGGDRKPIAGRASPRDEIALLQEIRFGAILERRAAHRADVQMPRLDVRE